MTTTCKHTRIIFTLGPRLTTWVGEYEHSGEVETRRGDGLLTLMARLDAWLHAVPAGVQCEVRAFGCPVRIQDHWTMSARIEHEWRMALEEAWRDEREDPALETEQDRASGHGALIALHMVHR